MVDVGSGEPDIGVAALVGVSTDTPGVVEATAGHKVDGTGGGPEVDASVSDRSGSGLCAVAAETALGAGDVDRDACPDVLF